MIIDYLGLDGFPHQADTDGRIDFLLDRDEGTAEVTCTVNGVHVTEEVYESVMTQLRAALA